MAEHSELVERADSLMRRRRSFVASPLARVESADVPRPSIPPIDDEDVPVLTEVVPAEAAVSEESPDHFDETRVALLASDIAHAIGQQLTADLPELLETVLINAREELRAGVTATMETALRDFIARRRQLPLPLDEPGRD